MLLNCGVGENCWESLQQSLQLRVPQLMLRLQSFGHLMRRTDSFEKTLILGKIEGRRRRGRQRMRWLMASLTQWTWIWVSSRSWWWTGKPRVLQSMGLQSQTWLRKWTELMVVLDHFKFKLKDFFCITKLMWMSPCEGWSWL